MFISTNAEALLVFAADLLVY